MSEPENEKKKLKKQKKNKDALTDILTILVEVETRLCHVGKVFPVTVGILLEDEVAKIHTISTCRP